MGGNKKQCTFCNSGLKFVEVLEDGEVELWECGCGSFAWYCGEQMLSCRSLVTEMVVEKSVEKDGWICTTFKC